MMKILTLLLFLLLGCLAHSERDETPSCEDTEVTLTRVPRSVSYDRHPRESYSHAGGPNSRKRLRGHDNYRPGYHGGKGKLYGKRQRIYRPKLEINIPKRPKTNINFPYVNRNIKVPKYRKSKIYLPKGPKAKIYVLEVRKPKIELPYVDRNINVPKFRKSKIELPYVDRNIKVPKYRKPDIYLPKRPKAKIYVPEVRKPKIVLPYVDRNINVPKFRKSKIELPYVDRNINVPKFRKSKIELPYVNRNIKVPKYRKPEIYLPKRPKAKIYVPKVRKLEVNFPYIQRKIKVPKIRKPETYFLKHPKAKINYSIGHGKLKQGRPKYQARYARKVSKNAERLYGNGKRNKDIYDSGHFFEHKKRRPSSDAFGLLDTVDEYDRFGDHYFDGYFSGPFHKGGRRKKGRKLGRLGYEGFEKGRLGKKGFGKGRRMGYERYGDKDLLLRRQRKNKYQGRGKRFRYTGRSIDGDTVATAADQVAQNNATSNATAPAQDALHDTGASGSNVEEDNPEARMRKEKAVAAAKQNGQSPGNAQSTPANSSPNNSQPLVDSGAPNNASAIQAPTNSTNQALPASAGSPRMIEDLWDY